MRLFTSSILLTLAQWTAAETHHLFASAYRSPHLFSLEYDTTTNRLSQVGTFNAHAGHPWLALAFDRTTLYGAERDGWSSYQVLGPTELAFQSNLTLRGRCDGGNYKHGTTSVIAETKAPYNIYGAGRSPCGNVMASRIDGSFERIVQNITYQPSSRVHGMALDPDNNYLYSADVSANGIWTHKIDPVKGTLTNARFKAHSEANARPRRLALHPTSGYLYVLLSRLNKVVVYTVRQDVRGPVLTETQQSFSLVPPGVNASNYRGHEVALSANNDILYVTSRYRVKRRDSDEEDEEPEEEGEDDDDDRLSAVDNDDTRFGRGPNSVPDSQPVQQTKRQSFWKRQFPWTFGPFGGGNTPTKPDPPAPVVLQPGFLTAILLTNPPSRGPGTPPGPPSTSDRGAGWPIRVILQVSTSTSGGKSNSVTPAPWANEFVALTDSEKGLVQVWRFDGLSELPRELPSSAVPKQVFPSPKAANPVPPNFPAANIPPKLVPSPPPPPPQSPPQSQTPAQRPPPWQYPNNNPAGRGSATRFYNRRQNPFNNVRANIVAEWTAPIATIGQGDPAAPKSQSQENDDVVGKRPRWGRGCCANAVWLD